MARQPTIAQLAKKAGIHPRTMAERTFSGRTATGLEGRVAALEKKVAESSSGEIGGDNKFRYHQCGAEVLELFQRHRREMLAATQNADDRLAAAQFMDDRILKIMLILRPEATELLL